MNDKDKTDIKQKNKIADEISKAEKEEKLEQSKKDANAKKASKKSTDEYIRILKFYYLPVFIVMIFLLVAVFAVLPSLKSLFANYTKFNDLKSQVADKDIKLIKLKELQSNSSKTQEYLTSINQIAPVEKTNVTIFQNTIKDTARQNRLSVESARGGEEIVADQETSKSFQLVEVPMFFVFSGDFTDLKNFLKDIYQGEDFIIIENMDLSRTSGNSSWKMQLTLVKYQFVQKDVATTPTTNQNTTISIKDLPINLTPSDKVLKFLDEKYLSSTSIDTTTE